MKTIITIDVEAHRGKTPIETFIWGRAYNGRRYGLELIVETLEKYGYKALFFVDFAEVFDYGEEAILEVVKYLSAHNQDIGLHLHPDHFGDKSRTFLWEYSYEEQYDMISKCATAFEKMVGQKPLFFRAGKFGANDDTIAALEALGIPFDSSAFYGHRWCKITNRKKVNKPYKISDTVIEIPVSVFSSLSLMGKCFRLDQVDLGCESREYRKVFKSQQKVDNDAVLTSFFHSFSFFPHRKYPEKLKFSKKAFSKFIKNLNFLRDNNIDVIGKDDITEMAKCLPIVNEADDKLPDSGSVFAQFAFLVERSSQIIQTNKKAQMLLLALSLCGMAFIAAAVIIICNLVG